jgi:hypothetical protein
LPFAEEAYSFVAVLYNPVHPKVLEAAGRLIECFRVKGDLYDAERFSQLTLESLKDPANGLDQESEAVAHGYNNYAFVIKEQSGDLVKAEMLAREALRIRVKLYNKDHYIVGYSTSLLANILALQGKLGCETMEFYERSLISISKIVLTVHRLLVHILNLVTFIISGQKHRKLYRQKEKINFCRNSIMRKFCEFVVGSMALIVQKLWK